MRWPPQLLPRDRKVYLDTLREGHDYRNKIVLYDLDEVEQFNLTMGGTKKDGTRLPVLLNDSGQTDLTAGAKGDTQTTRGRKCQFQIYDPDRVLGRVEGINAPHFIARHDYEVLTPTSDGDQWIPAPTITGPLVTCDRQGAVLTFTAQGMSSLFKHANRAALTIKAGTQITEAVKRILEERGGLPRSRMNIPDRPRTLGKDFTLPEKETPWNGAYSLMATLDLQLAPDGAGEIFARPWPTHKTMTMATGPGGWLLDPAQVQWDQGTLHNRVEVHGAKDIVGVAELPRDHPLSPHSLAFHDVDRVFELIIKRTQVKRQATADAQAQAALAKNVQETVTVSLNTFPFPLLDEADILRVKDGSYFDGLSLVNQWTLPWTAGNGMTIGWTDLRSAGPLRRR